MYTKVQCPHAHTERWDQFWTTTIIHNISCSPMSKCRLFLLQARTHGRIKREKRNHTKSIRRTQQIYKIYIGNTFTLQNLLGWTESSVKMRTRVNEFRGSSWGCHGCLHFFRWNYFLSMIPGFLFIMHKKGGMQLFSTAFCHFHRFVAPKKKTATLSTAVGIGSIAKMPPAEGKKPLTAMGM